MQLATDPAPTNGHANSWPAAVRVGRVDVATEARPLTRAGVARLGVVTALRAEVECLRHLGDGVASLTYVSGGSGVRARRGAEELWRQGAAGLVSFGFASGLAPILRPGDVVVAESVVLPSGDTIPTDVGWRAALMRRLCGSGLNVREARIAGSDEPLVSASAKRRAFQATFAAALDTESHAVAEVALSAGLPLLVVRAIAEPAEAMRPPVAFAGTSADGRTRSLAVVGHLAVRPWQIPAAWRFSRHGRLALDALRQVAALGPEPLAFPAG
jgi:adenosylhomocysteine nucleosidase